MPENAPFELEKKERRPNRPAWIQAAIMRHEGIQLFRQLIISLLQDLQIAVQLQILQTFHISVPILV